MKRDKVEEREKVGRERKLKSGEVGESLRMKSLKIVCF